MLPQLFKWWEIDIFFYFSCCLPDFAAFRQIFKLWCVFKASLENFTLLCILLLLKSVNAIELTLPPLHECTGVISCFTGLLILEFRSSKYRLRANFATINVGTSTNFTLRLRLFLAASDFCQALARGLITANVF